VYGQQWQQISGAGQTNANPFYGALNQGTEQTTPGSRYSSATATDATNRLLFLYGGLSNGTAATNTGVARPACRGDLWQYSTSGTNWSWISGNSSLLLPSWHGTRNVESPSTAVGCRMDAVLFYDLSGSNRFLYLFGGYVYSSNGNVGVSNAFWRYNLTSGYWSWRDGSSTLGQNTSPFGTANYPPALQSTAYTFISSVGLYMFGGYRPSGITVHCKSRKFLIPSIM
jgi:hypothetical protein